LNERLLNLIIGLAVPTVGAVIFNILGEMVKNGAHAPIPVADYDYSLGCVLAIFGVAVAQRQLGKARNLFVFSVLVLLMLIVVDIILRYRWSDWELEFIVAGDLVAILATGWAMFNSGAEHV
jgi:hypothetical protein